MMAELKEKEKDGLILFYIISLSLVTVADDRKKHDIDNATKISSILHWYHCNN